MPIVLQLTRVLESQPVVEPVDRLSIRTFGGQKDVAAWLEIRRQAFARQKVGIRAWNERDFSAEFLQRDGWRPEYLWFAEWNPSNGPTVLVGTVGIAWRRQPPEGQPAIHWLAVLPSHRRQGIGKALVRTAEAACWNLGCRQIWLETHTAWREAASLYGALGYRPTDAS